jgi:hypothetical protein
MARQYMTKEVTSTIIKAGKIVVSESGIPEVAVLEPITVLGTISQEKAQKRVNKLHGIGSTIFALETESKVYRMKVEDFIKIAELVTDENEGSDVDEDEDEDADEDTDADLENGNNFLEEEDKETKKVVKGSRIRRVAKEEV